MAGKRRLLASFSFRQSGRLRVPADDPIRPVSNPPKPSDKRTNPAVRSGRLADLPQGGGRIRPERRTIGLTSISHAAATRRRGQIGVANGKLRKFSQRRRRAALPVGARRATWACRRRCTCRRCRTCPSRPRSDPRAVWLSRHARALPNRVERREIRSRRLSVVPVENARAVLRDHGLVKKELTISGVAVVARECVPSYGCRRSWNAGNSASGVRGSISSTTGELMGVAT